MTMKTTSASSSSMMPETMACRLGSLEASRTVVKVSSLTSVVHMAFLYLARSLGRRE